jgi:hypothetical protein
MVGCRVFGEGRFMFGAGRSYAGSKLDLLIQSRVAEIRRFQPTHLELLAGALQREHPQAFEPPTNPGGPAQAGDQQTRDKAALGFANAVARLLISSTAAAEYIGKQIDQLRQSNSVAALALATCLAAYGSACNIPFDSSEGGFRRYLSGYLILRKSMRSFGVLEPWEKFVAETQALSPFFGDAWTEKLMGFIPQSENATLEKILQGLTQIKNSMGLIPGPVALMTLQTLLDEPLAADPWGEPKAGGPPSPGTCTTCGGSGKRSCAGCNGTGRITRPGRDGQLDITTCTVCYGSRRMRCDPCNGTGRR